MNNISKQDLINDIKKAGIKAGDILNLKISLKSIGWVEGGASTVIEAFLDVVGPQGTIVTDSFCHVKSLKYLKKHDFITDSNTASYAGAIANAMLKHPQVMRSNHPIQKFAVIGKHAKDFTTNHTHESYAYDILRRMSEMGAKNIRLGDPNKVIGVGTTHVAIGLTKLKQKRLPIGVHFMNNGIKETFLVNWAGGCYVGFNKLLPEYRKIGAFLYEGKIANADVVVSDMKTTLDWEIAEAKRNPSFFFCDNPACVDCRLSWQASSGNLLKVIWENIKIKRFDYAIYAIQLFFFGKGKPE